MPKFRSKIVEIEAVQFTGHNFFEIARFIGRGARRQAGSGFMLIARPRESDVQRSIIGWLKLRRIPHWRNNTGGVQAEYKGRSRFIRFGEPGLPDIVCIAPGGVFVGIECKRPLGPKGGSGGSEQTTDQRLVQIGIEQAGGVYILARSLADVAGAWDARWGVGAAGYMGLAQRKGA